MLGNVHFATLLLSLASLIFNRGFAFNFRHSGNDRLSVWTTSGPGEKKPSYIDTLDEGDADINSGLGKESLIYVDSDLIVVEKPSFAQTAPGFLQQDSLATRIQALFNLERIDHMVCHRYHFPISLNWS